MSSDTLKFGPNWIRQLSNPSSNQGQQPMDHAESGNVVNEVLSIPQSQQTYNISNKPVQLAKYRYGREDMIALLPSVTQTPPNIKPQLLSVEQQMPLANKPFDEHEQQLMICSVNSSTALRWSGGGRGNIRGGGVSGGGGRGAFHRSAYQTEHDYDDGYKYSGGNKYGGGWVQGSRSDNWRRGEQERPGKINTADHRIDNRTNYIGVNNRQHPTEGFRGRPGVGEPRRDRSLRQRTTRDIAPDWSTSRDLDHDAPIPKESIPSQNTVQAPDRSAAMDIGPDAPIPIPKESITRQRTTQAQDWSTHRDLGADAPITKEPIPYQRTTHDSDPDWSTTTRNDGHNVPATTWSMGGNSTPDWSIAQTSASGWSTQIDLSPVPAKPIPNWSTAKGGDWGLDSTAPPEYKKEHREFVRSPLAPTRIENTSEKNKEPSFSYSNRIGDYSKSVHFQPDQSAMFNLKDQQMDKITQPNLMSSKDVMIDTSSHRIVTKSEQSIEAKMKNFVYPTQVSSDYDEVWDDDADRNDSQFFQPQVVESRYFPSDISSKFSQQHVSHSQHNFQNKTIPEALPGSKLVGNTPVLDNARTEMTMKNLQPTVSYVGPTSGVNNITINSPEHPSFAHITASAENLVSDSYGWKKFHSPPMPQPQPPTQWYYKDPQDDVQGPFGDVDMMDWFTAGYFTQNLPVKNSINGMFEPLSSVILRNGGVIPFGNYTPAPAPSLVVNSPTSENSDSNPSLGLQKLLGINVSHSQIPCSVSFSDTIYSPWGQPQGSIKPDQLGKGNHDPRNPLSPDLSGLVQNDTILHGKTVALPTNQVTQELDKDVQPLGFRKNPGRELKSDPKPQEQLTMSQMHKQLIKKSEMEKIRKQKLECERLEAELKAQKEEEDRRREEDRIREQQRLIDEQKEKERQLKEEQQKREDEKKLLELQQKELKERQEKQREEELKRREEERQRKEEERRRLEDEKARKIEMDQLEALEKQKREAEKRSMLAKQPQGQRSGQGSLPATAKWGNAVAKPAAPCLTDIQQQQHIVREFRNHEDEERMVREQTKQHKVIPNTPQPTWNASYTVGAKSLIDIQREQQHDNGTVGSRQAIGTTGASPNKGKKSNLVASKVEETKKDTDEDILRKLFDSHTKSELAVWAEGFLGRGPKLQYSEVDIPTFISFLEDIESPYEVHEYIRSYLGESSKTMEFGKEFIKKKKLMADQVSFTRSSTMVKTSETQSSIASKIGRQTNRGSQPGWMMAQPPGACQPSRQMPVDPAAETRSDQTASKKTKKGKKDLKRVDPSILGFSVTSASDRMNAGGIDLPEK